MLWNQEGLADFSQVPTFQYYHYSPSSPQNYYKILIIFSFLLSSTKTNHYLPLQEACGKQVFKIAWKLSPRQERALNDPSPPFKEKEKGGEGGSKAWRPMECSKLGGHWNVPSLVAIGMFQAWWPLECSKLGGHWSVSILVAIGVFQSWWPLECSKFGGQWKVKEKHLFTSSIFPQQTYLHPQFFFLLALRFYFTMVLSRYSRLSFLFFDL